MFKRILIIIAIISLAGCSSFQDNKVPVKPKPIDTSSREFLMALSTFVKNRYQTDKTVEEIMTDIAVAQYYLEKAK